jgi:hypothetical protein
MSPRPQKITFAELRAQGVHGILVYCADYHCSCSTAISADPWPDEVRLSDIEPSSLRSAVFPDRSRGASWSAIGPPSIRIVVGRRWPYLTIEATRTAWANSA